MIRPRKLIIGASGFLGSHVARQLVTEGEDVRVMLRPTSSTRGIDDLRLEHCYGDIFDDDALRAAMTGCDVIYYCVVDARMWLRDPAPLFRTNVDGLRHVLDAAVRAQPRAFVFTSTTGTLAIHPTRPTRRELVTDMPSRPQFASSAPRIRRPGQMPSDCSPEPVQLNYRPGSPTSTVPSHVSRRG